MLDLERAIGDGGGIVRCQFGAWAAASKQLDENSLVAIQERKRDYLQHEAEALCESAAAVWEHGAKANAARCQPRLPHALHGTWGVSRRLWTHRSLAYASSLGTGQWDKPIGPNQRTQVWCFVPGYRGLIMKLRSSKCSSAGEVLHRSTR